MGQNTMEDEHPEGILRGFTLPVKLPFETLMSKYRGELDITMGNKMYDLLDKLIDKKNLKTNSRGTAVRNHRNVTLRPKATREQNNNKGDDPECLITSDKAVKNSKTPYKPIKRSNQASNVYDLTTAATTKTTFLKPQPVASKSPNVYIKKTAKRRRGAEKAEAKPGTLGSRQTLPILRKTPKFSVHDDDELIDTKNRVNADIMVSTEELCQRLKLKKVPDDPTDLLKKFSLIIPRLGHIDQYINDD